MTRSPTCRLTASDEWLGSTNVPPCSIGAAAVGSLGCALTRLGQDEREQPRALLAVFRVGVSLTPSNPSASGARVRIARLGIAVGSLSGFYGAAVPTRASFPCVDFECSPMRPLLRLLCPPLHKPSCPIGFCIKRQF